MNEPKIVFLGTSEFAVASLGALLMNGMNVTMVVTAPDKPAGRGRKLSLSPVKEFAEFSSLPVLQPENLEEKAFIDTLKSLNADMFVVVAFRILPKAVWKLPPMGTINLHASLLPQYRGAAPINRAIINGETKSGITTFLIDENVDTGSVLLQDEVDIYPFENAGDLHNKLMKLGALLVIRTINGMMHGIIKPKAQSLLLNNHEQVKTAPKIFPADCNINWNESAEKIHNLVRGLSPYPGARSIMTNGSKNISFKIIESFPEKSDHQLAVGTIISEDNKILRVACNDGFIRILIIQLEGKKRMNTDEFLRGFDISSYRAETA
jgi:methionyl-tRNA formyltransferase